MEGEQQKRRYAETVDVESESEAAKRRCISSDGCGGKRETFVPANLTSSERRSLRKRFRSELDTVRVLLNKPEFSVPVAVNRVAALSAAPRGGKKGFHRSRGAMGRFLPKPQLQTSAVVSDAVVFKQCAAILKKLMNQKYSYLFNEPVDVEALNIPDYFDVIKHPMDLGTIKKKLSSGSYESLWAFAADVRLTFTNAMTYNLPGNAVHLMAVSLSKMFEAWWKPIERKLSTAGKPCINYFDGKVPSSDCSHVLTKQKVSFEETELLASNLASLAADLPDHIIELLQRCCSNVDNEEIEIDIHNLSDDTLFELKKQVDAYMQEREPSQQAKSDLSDEAANVSGLSHSSTHPCKGGESVEEDVDICGNASPIVVEKNATRTINCTSPSSSTSNSGSSSDSDSETESESDDKVVSPTKLSKGSNSSEQTLDQEKSDVINSLDAHRPANDLELQEQDSQSKPAQHDLRTALLVTRYRDTIVKAHGILNQGGKRDKQEELEKQQEEERARLLAQCNAAIELEREKARQALQEMESTVQINDSLHPKDLEMLGTATAAKIASSVDELSAEHSQDGLPFFVPGSSKTLEGLGLFMKADDDEEEEEELSTIREIKETEEGEIN